LWDVGDGIPLKKTPNDPKTKRIKIMKGKQLCKHKLTLESKDKKKTETSQDLDIDITTKT